MSPSPRILVVEDDPVNLMVITRMLEHLGHRAEVAQDGLRAVSMASQTPYDVVFMDVMMPNLDGIQATRLIRASGAGEPHIVAITANAISEDRNACFEAGMDDFVTKPVRLDTVRNLLATLLDGPSIPDLDQQAVDDLFEMLGDADVFTEILNEYVANSLELIRDFDQAVHREDWKAARRAVHSLRSSSATFGGLGLQAACQDAENRGPERWKAGLAEEIVAQLTHLRWRHCAKLTAYRDDRAGQAEGV